MFIALSCLAITNYNAFIIIYVTNMALIYQKRLVSPSEILYVCNWKGQVITCILLPIVLFLFIFIVPPVGIVGVVLWSLWFCWENNQINVDRMRCKSQQYIKHGYSGDIRFEL